MKVEIVARNISVTQGMTDEAKDRLKVVEKFLGDDDKIKLTVVSTKKNLCLTAMFLFDGKLVKIEKNGDDYYELLNEMADSLKVKLDRLHKKQIKRASDQKHVLDPSPYDYVPEKGRAGLIAREKQIDLEEMTPEEAIEKMEELAHESFIFKNIDTGKTCMIYLRNDARYGLIETN